MENFEQFIKDKIVNERWSHRQLKEHFASQFPGERGFSIRSIQTGEKHTVALKKKYAYRTVLRTYHATQRTSFEC